MNYFIRKLRALKLTKFEAVVMFGVRCFSMFVKSSIMSFPLYANITPEWRYGLLKANTTFQSETDDIATKWGQNCNIYHNYSYELTTHGSNNNISHSYIENTHSILNEHNYRLEFRSPFYSARQEFGMFCNHAYQAAFVATIQYLGVLIGALTMGPVTDAFGRRYVWAAFIAGQIAFSVISSFSTGSISLTILRFLCGLFCGGDFVTGYVYVMEMIKPQQRMFMNVFADMPVDFLLLAMYYFTADWRLSLRTIPLVSIPSLMLLLFVVPESTKWAKDLGKLDVAAKSEARIAWINGKTMSSSQDTVNDIKVSEHDKYPTADCHSNVTSLLGNTDMPLQTNDNLVSNSQLSISKLALEDSVVGDNDNAKENTSGQNVVKRPRITIKSLFATRQLTIKTGAMCYFWISVALVSYAIKFDSRNLDGNFYLNQLFRSIGLAGSGIVTFAFDTYIPNFNRRVLHQVPQVIIVAITVSVGVLYAANVEDTGRAAITILALSVSYFLGPIWNAVYMCTAEVFPTEVRGTSYSICNLFARLGVMLAPQVILLREFWPAAPYFIMAAVTLGASIISYHFLPDTKDKPLPGNVEEASQSVKKRSNC